MTPRSDRLCILLHHDMVDGPQIGGLTDAAFRTYITLMCRASRTDGFVRPDMIDDDAPRDLYDSFVSMGLIAESGALAHWVGVVRNGRRAIPDAVRFQVYERDRWLCIQCGSPETLSLDHIFPWSKGGSDEPDNLQTMCLPCNLRKGARI